MSTMNANVIHNPRCTHAINSWNPFRAMMRAITEAVAAYPATRAEKCEMMGVHPSTVCRIEDDESGQLLSPEKVHNAVVAGDVPDCLQRDFGVMHPVVESRLDADGDRLKATARDRNCRAREAVAHLTAYLEAPTWELAWSAFRATAELAVMHQRNRVLPPMVSGTGN